MTIATIAHITPRITGTLQGEGSELEGEGNGSDVEFVAVARNDIVLGIIWSRKQI